MANAKDAFRDGMLNGCAQLAATFVAIEACGALKKEHSVEDAKAGYIKSITETILSMIDDIKKDVKVIVVQDSKPEEKPIMVKVDETHG